MIIDVLVLNADGTQKFEKREVPDDCKRKIMERYKNIGAEVYRPYPDTY